MKAFATRTIWAKADTRIRLDCAVIGYDKE